MKYILLVLITLSPLCTHADIIATKNGKIENVKVVSIDAKNVVYKQGDTEKTIASSEVEGVLYDDGRFVVPPSQREVSVSTESLPDSADDIISSSDMLKKKGDRNFSGSKNSMTRKSKWMLKMEQLKMEGQRRKELRNQIRQEIREQLKAEREEAKSNSLRSQQGKELESDKGSTTSRLTNYSNW